MFSALELKVTRNNKEYYCIFNLSQVIRISASVLYENKTDLQFVNGEIETVDHTYSEIKYILTPKQQAPSGIVR